MPRPIEAIIDLSALRNNVSVVRRHAGSAKVYAVVKANGYGHGLERIIPALHEVDGFAVVESDLALRIRGNDINKPVLLLQGFFDENELASASKYGFNMVVHELSQVELLTAVHLPKPIDVYLKINTGMNRLGFVADDVARIHARLAASGNVRDIVLMTHFADADGARGVEWQLQPLLQLASSLRTTICAANSAALLRYPQSRGEWVRPGLMLYGASPFADVTAAQLGLQPVMTLRSRIIAIQQLKPGDCVGYGCTFTATAPMRIAVIAAGYGDGYPRHAPAGTPALVDGKRVGTLGRVSMDSLCVDITNLADASVGSAVTLWGEGVPVEDVATSAGTVSYELLTKVTSRVPFVVRG